MNGWGGVSGLRPMVNMAVVNVRSAIFMSSGEAMTPTTEALVARYRPALNGAAFMGMARDHGTHCGPEYAPDGYGVYVLAKDYDALQARVTVLQDAISSLEKLNLRLYEHEALHTESSGMMQDQINGLRRDAERYRWLAQHVAGDEEGDFCLDTRLHIDDHAPFETDADIKGALDKAIDDKMSAAMAAGEKA